MAKYLRDAATLFDKVDTSSAEVSQCRATCTIYFNLLALFYFHEDVNLTWSIGSAIPYHAELLYNKYKVVFGIISLQAKESKHSGVKQDLNLTNRSRSTTVGKGWQLTCTNEHFICQSINQLPLLIYLITSHVFLQTVRMLSSVMSVEDHLVTAVG